MVGVHATHTSWYKAVYSSDMSWTVSDCTAETLNNCRSKVYSTIQQITFQTGLLSQLVSILWNEIGTYVLDIFLKKIPKNFYQVRKCRSLLGIAMPTAQHYTVTAKNNSLSTSSPHINHMQSCWDKICSSLQRKKKSAFGYVLYLRRTGCLPITVVLSVVLCESTQLLLYKSPIRMFQNC